MLDPDGAGPAARSGARDARTSWPRRSAPRADVDPAEVYEIALAGNATMVQLALGVDPEPLGVAPFISRHPHVPRDAGHRPRRRACTPARGPSCCPRSAPTSAATSSPGMLAFGHGPRQAAAAVHRRRHELRDRARQRRQDRFPPRRRPGRRSRGAPSAAACARPTGPSRSSRSSDDDVQLQVIGDVEPQGLCGSGLVDAVAELVEIGLLDSSRPPLGDDAGRRAVAGPGRPPGARSTASGSSCCLAGRWWATSTTPSTCQPARRARAAVRQGRHLDRLAPARGGARRGARATSSRCCWPARSAPTCRRPARCASVSSRSCPCCASSARATSPARAPKMALLVDAGAQRRPGVAGGGALCRALRPAPTSTTGSSSSSPSPAESGSESAVVPVDDRSVVPRSERTATVTSPSSPAARSPNPARRSSTDAGGRSIFIRCPRCCTTDRSGSPARSSGSRSS